VIIKILFPSALHCTALGHPFFDFTSFSTWPFLVLGHNLFYSQGVFGWDNKTWYGVYTIYDVADLAAHYQVSFTVGV